MQPETQKKDIYKCPTQRTTCGVTRGASIFGRLISSVKKIGGYVFKSIHGLFHHHKVQAIYHAVNTFKKYHSKLKIGQLFKFKAYHDLHISKVSLYDKT